MVWLTWNEFIAMADPNGPIRFQCQTPPDASRNADGRENLMDDDNVIRPNLIRWTPGALVRLETLGQGGINAEKKLEQADAIEKII